MCAILDDSRPNDDIVCWILLGYQRQYIYHQDNGKKGNKKK